MKRWLWFVLAILLSTGTYFTIRYGLRPKPIPVMNATSFDNLQEIGAVTYRRLRQDIHSERLVVLGSSPEISHYFEVWTGLVKTAVADKLNIDVIFQSEEIVAPITADGMKVVPFNAATIASGELIAQVKAELQQGHFVLIHAPSEIVSHLGKNSLSAQLEVVAQHPVLALSTFALSYYEADREIIRQRCENAAPEDEFSKHVSCGQVRLVKLLKKKQKNPASRIWSIIERHGLKEYLVFIHDR